MKDKTKDELIDTLNLLVHHLEEEKANMGRHIFVLQRENEELRQELNFKSSYVSKFT